MLLNEPYLDTEEVGYSFTVCNDVETSVTKKCNERKYTKLKARHFYTGEFNSELANIILINYSIHM